MNELKTFWSVPLLVQLQTQESGLSEDEALQRRKTTKSIKALSPFKQDALLLLKQFKNPLQLILIIAVILSSALAEYTTVQSSC